MTLRCRHHACQCRSAKVLGDLSKRLHALLDLLRVRFSVDWPLIALSLGPAGAAVRVDWPLIALSLGPAGAAVRFERTGWWLSRWSYVGQTPSWRHGSAGLGLLRVLW
jgi:hypothetical protein